MSSYPAIKTQTEPLRPAGVRPSPLFKDIPGFPIPRPIFDFKHTHIGGPLCLSKLYLKVIFTIVVMFNHNKTPDLDYNEIMKYTNKIKGLPSTLRQYNQNVYILTLPDNISRHQ